MPRITCPTPRAIGTGQLNLLTFGQKGDPPLFVSGDIEAFSFIFLNNFLNIAITVRSPLQTFLRFLRFLRFLYNIFFRTIFFWHLYA